MVEKRKTCCAFEVQYGLVYTDMAAKEREGSATSDGGQRMGWRSVFLQHVFHKIENKKKIPSKDK